MSTARKKLSPRRTRWTCVGALALGLLALSACSEDEKPLCVEGCEAVRARIGHWPSQAGEKTWADQIDCTDPKWVERSTSCPVCSRLIEALTPTDLRPADVSDRCTLEELNIWNSDAGLPPPG
jgi:hypothetical protein